MNDWKNLEKDLMNTIKVIFSGYNLDNLSFYERRKIIFEYLTNVILYDFVLLEEIKNFQLGKSRITRNPIKELESVINDKKGICNAISQYYKLLLEVVGIKSYAVICDDGTEVNHQLNLVYDEENDSYSFDDITSVVVKRGNIDEYFDYDLEYSHSIKQGTKEIMDKQEFVILPEEYINYLVNREESFSENLDLLPTNIISLKNKSKTI